MAESKKKTTQKDNLNEESAEKEMQTGVEEAEENLETGADTEAAENSADEAEAEASETPESPEEEKEEESVRYARLFAEFQNFKRRTQQEKNDIYQYANEKIATDLIDVMDNFERAMVNSESVEDKKFAEGVELIYKQLKGVLEKHNIIEIESDGAKFDPNFHNAIMAEENPDFESGMVIQTLQKGYTLNGKCIRPAMVKVSQ